MVTFQIRIAEITVGVTAFYNNTMLRSRGYLCENEEESFHVTVDEQDIEKEKQIFIERALARGETDYKVFGFHLDRNAVYRKIAEKMIDYDRILIHGSSIAVDGRGYLFIAPSGTGKSTHTRLWREAFGERVIMINDDKPLIHVSGNEAVIYGTPWDGKHHLSTNTGVPLKGICRIVRAEENSIRRLSTADAFTAVLEQTYRSVSPLRLMHTMDLLKQMLQEIPVFELSCNMDISAAYTAYEAMANDQ